MNTEKNLNFVDVDSKVVVEDMITRFEEYTGRKLYDGDIIKIMLMGFAYMMIDAFNMINIAALNNLLRYAEEQKLNEFAYSFNLSQRIQAKKAATKVKIKVSLLTYSSTLTIPAGTRVTSDGIRMFELQEAAVFKNDDDLVDGVVVNAVAAEPGSNYNNIGIGEINVMVDGNSFVKSVENITTTSGGNDEESDDDYRERLRIDPFGLSVAGPSNAYESIAKSVSVEIGDVKAYSPEKGVVEIAVVKQKGMIPGKNDELIEKIKEACSDKQKRPLTDFVRVVPANSLNITIDIDYYSSDNEVADANEIYEAVKKYKVWQTEKIGRDVNPDILRKMLMDAGASRVDIRNPIYTKMNENQIANITSESVSYKGLINM